MLAISGPGGRRFKSSLPDHLFSSRYTPSVLPKNPTVGKNATVLTSLDFPTEILLDGPTSKIRVEDWDKLWENALERLHRTFMQKSLKNPRTLNSSKPKPEYLGFQTIVNQTVWPIVVIKFNGRDAYCWDWMRGGPGHLLLYADFETQNVGSFGKYKESHVSYHESGTRQHSVVRGKQEKLRLSLTQGTPVAQIRQPISVASVPAPLTSPLPHKLNIPEWNRATKMITLKSCDFHAHQDIYLRVYLCGKEFVQMLAKQYRFGNWVLGSGNTRLVIAADPY
jgi:hypothetical protein